MARPDPDLLVVWQDDDVSWRKVTYYFRSRPVWVLEHCWDPRWTPWQPRLWVGNRIIQVPPNGQFGPLLLPWRGRVAWLLHLHSRFPEELRAQGVPLAQLGKTAFLTDLTGAPQQFRAGPFLFQRAPQFAVETQPARR